MQATCQRCHSSFNSGSRTRKYCSMACYNASKQGRVVESLRKPPESRICPACQKTFLVGGVGCRSRRQHICSRACADQLRYRHGYESAILGDTDAAYLAGLADGEGTINLTTDRQSLAIRFGIGNSHLGVLEWVRDVTKVGFIHTIMPTSTNHIRRPQHYWQCNGLAAVGVLAQLLPHLKIKREQAELAINAQAQRVDPALKADRTWQTDYRERMQALNRRGPRPQEIVDD